ncbi:MAG: metallophosphoesterase [Verrucomicrobia bacterium]|nr:metallophosphoesterase [Verrucomicrobiota bacterium]MDA1088603.1 metallophosphoesterase [Verrucomicrobiota bacterium]
MNPRQLLRSRRRPALAATALLLGTTLVLADPAPFEHDVTTDAKPWTHTNFRNDPAAFQFAIVSDNTGGARPGVFASAVKKLNLLQPEFVLSVGDMIEGYTDDTVVLDEEWSVFNAYLKEFDMPFFYVPGNHDISTPSMARMWEEKYGRRYYSFVYKDVLFVCLDSQDGPNQSAGLGDQQIAWATSAIAARPDVRWTIVMLHQPLWVYEEGNFVTARKFIGAPQKTGFQPVEEALAGRDYTVFAGHFHSYVKFMRHDQRYFILASTGGASLLRGIETGEFDHGVWVTMTTNGPVLANLLLDGIQTEDVYTEEKHRYVGSLEFSNVSGLKPRGGITFEMAVTNVFNHPMEVVMEWSVANSWTVAPARVSAIVAPGQHSIYAFSARYTAPDMYPRWPTCVATFTAGHEFMHETHLRVPGDIDEYLQSVRPTTTAPRLAAAPVIDGQLDDDSWANAVHIESFQDWTLQREAEVKTEVWLGYDDENLYCAFRCQEPEMSGVAMNETNRDGNVFLDDVVEIFISPDVNDNVYYHIAVNPAGTLYDGVVFDKDGFTADIRATAARDADGWSVEMAIPLAAMQIKPAEAGSMGLLLARDRKVGRRTVMQHPPLNGWNHRKENHGRLLLGAAAEGKP